MASAKQGKNAVMARIQEVLLGRYQLLDVLGRGGMGVVYRAADRVLDRTVAVKVLAGERAEEPTFVTRFEREARAAAALSHPNIVAVYDSGRDGHARFIVMECVSGTNLAQLVRRCGPLPAEQAVNIARQVAGALAAAHRAGIIHRDIKPANVMVDEAGTVKVLDFGIARATGSTTLTQAAILGSAPYIAPEVTRGQRADERSDIYSLGCVLYETLTGQPPFTGELPAAIMHQHNTATPRARRLGRHTHAGETRAGDESEKGSGNGCGGGRSADRPDRPGRAVGTDRPPRRASGHGAAARRAWRLRQRQAQRRAPSRRRPPCPYRSAERPRRHQPAGVAGDRLRAQRPPLGARTRRPVRDQRWGRVHAPVTSSGGRCGAPGRQAKGAQARQAAARLRLELAARRRDRRLAARLLACAIELAPHSFALVGDLKSTFEHQHGRRWLAVEPQRSAQVVQRVGVAQAGFADWLEAGVEPHAGGGQRS